MHFSRHILDFWTIFKDSCVATRSEKQWHRLFGLVECESQPFLSFLRLLYSFYFSDRTDEETTEKRKKGFFFLSPMVFSSASFFLSSHPPSFFSPVGFSDLSWHTDYLPTNKPDRANCCRFTLIWSVGGSSLLTEKRSKKTLTHFLLKFFFLIF